MSAEDALQRLGQSTGEACLGVLEMFAAGKVSMGEVTISSDAKSAFLGVPVHTGRPGRSGSRRAVQVTGPIGGPK